MASTEPAFLKAITVKDEKTMLWYKSIVESQAFHGPKLLQNVSQEIWHQGLKLGWDAAMDSVQNK